MLDNQAMRALSLRIQAGEAASSLLIREEVRARRHMFRLKLHTGATLNTR